MDIKNFVPESDTIIIELEYNDVKLTNEDGSPMTVEVYLPHTVEHKAAEYKQIKSIRDKINKGELKPEDELSFIDSHQMQINTLAETTKAWNITYDGKKPKLTEKKAVEIYSAAHFIPELIVFKKGEAEGFTKA